MNNFSTRLKKLMEEQGLTQQALAEKARTSQASIFRYLSQGVTPQPKTLADLALALRVRPEWLATGQGDRSLPYALSHGQRHTLEDARATLAAAPEISAVLNESIDSIFARMSEPDLFEFVASTASTAPSLSPVQRRVAVHNLTDATTELRRRLPPVTYRHPQH